MVKLNISFNNEELARLQSVLKPFSAENFPRTARALLNSAEDIAEKWRGYAGGWRGLEGVEPLAKPSMGYLKGVKVNMLGAFDYEIVNASKMAKQVEEGSPELDMKKTHPYGPRSRMSKKGTPYLIVPFQWGTPGAVGFKNIMPQAVYNIVKNKRRFQTTRARMTTHNEPNAKGEQVARREYEWGDRLGAGYEGTNLAGMVRMDGQIEGGRKRSSGYFTFRVISANSPQGSWIRKAIPPRLVTKALAEESREETSRNIETAILSDLE